MKFLKKLILFIVVIAILVLVYRHYKDDIAGFLNDKGIHIPGITDDTDIFPSSETVVDAGGNMSVVVSIPETYSRDITDDHINQIVTGSEGRLTAVREEDGSLSLTLSDEYRNEILEQMNSYYDDAVINNLIGGNVVSIDHNHEYTVFTVSCVQGMSEGDILALTGKLFAVGKLYASFSGRSDTNICVVIVDSADSSVTNTYLSDKIGEGLASDAQQWAGNMIDQTVSGIAERLDG